MSLRLRLAHVAARELGYTETRVNFSVIECTCIARLQESSLVHVQESSRLVHVQESSLSY